MVVFHSGSECRLAQNNGFDGEQITNYSIMSQCHCPGVVRLCPVSKQWTLRLESYAYVTQGFLVKVWECLTSKLTKDRDTGRSNIRYFRQGRKR